MRNKEEKLRNKLKKQGLSEKEIEKIVKSKNKKLAPKLIVGTFATALIVAGVVFVVNNFKKGNSEHSGFQCYGNHQHFTGRRNWKLLCYGCE